MRNALLILLLTITQLCNGQNYKCLQPGVKRYFVNGDGYVRGMRIDSTTSSGSNTIYFPFHTARGHYDPFSTIILDSNGGSWLGKRVIENSIGIFLFDNIWNDTVTIHTQAHTGDTWRFYDDTTNQYYTATVIAEDTMTVLSSVDSVKKIRINAYKAAGKDTTDPVDNFELVLSKDHGFLQVFDLYVFPYHKPDTVYGMGNDYFLDYISGQFGFSYLLGSPAPAQHIFSLIDMINPTFRQLNDWNPGDAFEVKEIEEYNLRGLSHPSRYYYDSITNKTVFGDHTEYSYTGWIASRHLPSGYWTIPDWYEKGYPFDTATVTGTFTFTDSLLIDTTRMPEEVGTSFHFYYNTADTSYCSKATRYAFIKIYYGHYFEHSGPDYLYKNEIGGVRYNRVDLSDLVPINDDNTLIYYRKDGIECGKYVTSFPIYDPTGITDLHQQEFSLLPNPVTNTLAIAASVNIEQVTITNMLGEVVYKNAFGAKEVNISTELLPPGMYLARINGVEVRKFIKQ